MIIILLISACALILIARLCLYLFNRPGTIYLDDNKAKTLYSAKYNIAAKPDEMLNNNSGSVVLKEYKSRWSGIYPSDKAQIIASAIAARGSGYNVTTALLETGSGKIYKVRLEHSTEQMYAKIAVHAEQARIAISGSKPRALPKKGKCSGCSYKHACPYSK